MSNSLPSFADRRPLLVQSNGMGLQSFCMYLMSAEGFLPFFDHSIFVDTGGEKAETMRALDYLLTYAAKNDAPPITVVSKLNLLEQSINDLRGNENIGIMLPVFTISANGKKGMLKRLCTQNVKIDQVNMTIRQVLGLRKRQFFPPVNLYLGITVDEQHRMSIPRIKKFTNVYPFIGVQAGYDQRLFDSAMAKKNNFPWSRLDCKNWLKRHDHMIPPKSSCVFCPYTSQTDWVDMHDNRPYEFAISVEIDDLLRSNPPLGVRDTCYLHFSRTPLKDAWKSGSEGGLQLSCMSSCHI